MLRRFARVAVRGCSAALPRVRPISPCRTLATTDASDPPHPPKRLHMVFTCVKCETRAVKSFTKNAYDHGVVLVTCPGCQARHVIADNLGWFGEEKNVEEVLRGKGETVRVITDQDVDYSP